MTDRIHVVPDSLRAAAAEHRRTAEQLAAIPASHPQIQASLDSLGPIYAELAEAGRHLLEQRRRCYAEQSAEHARTADALTAAAAMWEQHERDAAARFSGLAGER